MAITTYTITMGQAFRESLPSHIRDIGGHVLSVRLDGSSTLVEVRASFDNMTARKVQRLLWDAIPGPSISVR